MTLIARILGPEGLTRLPCFLQMQLQHEYGQDHRCLSKTDRITAEEPTGGRRRPLKGPDNTHRLVGLQWLAHAGNMPKGVPAVDSGVVFQKVAGTGEISLAEVNTSAFVEHPVEFSTENTGRGRQ